MKAVTKTPLGVVVTIEFPDPKNLLVGERAPSPEEQIQHLQQHVEHVATIFGELVAGIACTGLPLACGLFQKLEDALDKHSTFCRKTLGHVEEEGIEEEFRIASALLLEKGMGQDLASAAMAGLWDLTHPMD